MKARVRYEVDPGNRLVVKKTNRRSTVKRFRQVLYGRFKTGAKNKLYYEVTSPSNSDTPKKIKFSGEYSLDKEHNLIYTLNKSNNQSAGNYLRLKTGIIGANDREMIFLVNSRESEKEKTLDTMKLSGAWRVDENNRLVFGVKKEGDRKDNLTLSNAWQIGRNNEIEYTCGRNKVIAFKGRWEIMGNNRISYTLNKDIDSGFDFRASLGKIAPRGEKSYVLFDINVDISRKKRITRQVSFTGKLKPGRGREILLEVSPGKNKAAVLKLTREMLDQKGMLYVEAFLKDKEKYLGGGLVFKW